MSAVRARHRPPSGGSIRGAGACGPERQMSVVSIARNFAWIAGLVLALLVQSAAARAGDMTFRLVPIGDPTNCKSRCVVAIAAEGEITNSTPDEFVAFLM